MGFVKIRHYGLLAPSHATTFKWPVASLERGPTRRARRAVSAPVRHADAALP
jgi:hypothetical protein